MTTKEKYKALSFSLQHIETLGGLEALLKFADSIEEQDLRTRVLFDPLVLKRRLEIDPDVPIELLAEIEDDGIRDDALLAFRRSVLRTSRPAEVLDVFVNSTIESKLAVLDGITLEWMGADMNAALDWVGNLEAGDIKDSILAMRWQKIAEVDAGAAAKWIESIDSPSLRSDLKDDLNKYIESNH